MIFPGACRLLPSLSLPFFQSETRPCRAERLPQFSKQTLHGESHVITLIIARTDFSSHLACYGYRILRERSVRLRFDPNA